MRDVTREVMNEEVIAGIWEYMSASRYNLYDVKIKNLRLVGPHLKEGAACEG